MIQQSLLDWVAPKPFEARGDTFKADRDSARLGEQCQRVYNAMKSGDWLTLAQISEITGDPEASISARYRDLKRFGFQMEREYLARGLHQYRMVR